MCDNRSVNDIDGTTSPSRTNEEIQEAYEELLSYVRQLQELDTRREGESNNDHILRSSSHAMVEKLVSEVPGTKGDATAIQAMMDEVETTLDALELEKKSMSMPETRSGVGASPAEGGETARQVTSSSRDATKGDVTQKQRSRPQQKSRFELRDNTGRAWVRYK